MCCISATSFYVYIFRKERHRIIPKGFQFDIRAENRENKIFGATTLIFRVPHQIIFKVAGRLRAVEHLKEPWNAKYDYRSTNVLIMNDRKIN